MRLTVSELANKTGISLLLKRERLDGIIRLVEHTLRGENTMSFDEFDMTEIEAARKEYEEETKLRYSGTASYEESKRRTDSYGKEDWQQISKEADDIFAAFAECSKAGIPADAAKAQALVLRWQDHISRYYYKCTDEILSGLGLLYAGDERFRKNIDRAGAGTARYMSEAIEIYAAERTH